MKWLRELWETYGPPWMTEGLVVFFEPPEWVWRLFGKHPPRVTEEDFEALREIKAEADAIRKSNTERRRRLGLLLIPVLLLMVVTLSGNAVAELGAIDNIAKTRTVVGEDGLTYIEFYRITGDIFYTPATRSAEAHYPAIVRLYRKDGENLIYINEREGWWINDGCFEMDIPVPY